MPFGPYSSFDDCVSKNSDKDDPKAYCGKIKHEIESEGGSKHGEFKGVDVTEVAATVAHELEPGVLRGVLRGKPLYAEEWIGEIIERYPGVKLNSWAEADITTLFNMIESDIRNHEGQYDFTKHAPDIPGWVSIEMFKDGDLMRTIDVFRAGTHTDSSGITREWGIGDLRNMIKAFDAHVPGRVPIKVGHTSDKFNQNLATKLGIPPEILLGENGEGAASLGHIAKLHLDGDKLRADIELSPPLSKLVDDRLFTDVSAEIFDHRSDGNGVDYGPVLSAVAILGAERPAVKDLVAFSTKLDGLMPSRVLAFTEAFTNWGDKAGQLAQHEEHDPAMDECVKKHMDEGMSKDDAMAKCKESRMAQDDQRPSQFAVSGRIVSKYIDWISVRGGIDPIDDRLNYMLDDDFLPWLKNNYPEVYSSIGDETSEAGDWYNAIYAEYNRRRANEGLPPIEYSDYSDYREAIRAASGGIIPEEDAAKAEHVLRGVFRDALLSGTIQRTGWGNTIRSAWDLLQESLYKGFSEYHNADAHGGQVASVILHQSVARRESDAKKWLTNHKYKVDDWDVKQLGSDWVMRPIDSQLIPTYNYGQIDVVDGVTAIIGTPIIEQPTNVRIISQYSHATGEGDLPMVKEAEVRSALGIGPKDDLVAAVKKLKEVSTFSETQAATLNSLAHDRRVMHYEEFTRPLTTITGTPRELADKLAKLEESVSPKEATDLLASWQGVQAAAERVGVLSTFSKPTNSANLSTHPFERVVKDIAEKDKVTIPVAMVRASRLHPSEFREYNEAVKKGEVTANI